MVRRQVLILTLSSSPVRSMQEERAKAKFNIRELTYLLDGDEKATEVKVRRGEGGNQYISCLLYSIAQGTYHVGSGKGSSFQDA